MDEVLHLHFQKQGPPTQTGVRILEELRLSLPERLV